jgi:hypothetical protein
MGASSVAPGHLVLALLNASEIPAVPSLTALAGLTAGFMAAVTYAQRHDAGAALMFNCAVQAARKHADYEYSHEFLRGVELALPELAALASQIGETS